MLKTIFRLIILSIFLISIFWEGSTSAEALVKGWTPPTEQSSSYTSNGKEDPVEIVIIPSEDNPNIDNERLEDKKNINNYPDLGSDQVFPFLPGLDSY